MNMPEFYDSFKDYSTGLKERKIASLIVKLSDVISVLQYSNNEIELGNSSKSMQDINNDAKNRVETLYNELMHKLSKS